MSFSTLSSTSLSSSEHFSLLNLHSPHPLHALQSGGVSTPNSPNSSIASVALVRAEMWKLFPTTGRAAEAPCRDRHSALILSPSPAFSLLVSTPVRTCPHPRGVCDRQSFPFSTPPLECSCLSVMEMSSPAAPHGLLNAPSRIPGKSLLITSSFCSFAESMMLSTPTVSIRWTLPVLSSTPIR